jgi:hypothetical protein
MKREIYCDENFRDSWYATRGWIFHVHLEYPFDFGNGKDCTPFTPSPRLPPHIEPDTQEHTDVVYLCPFEQSTY